MPEKGADAKARLARNLWNHLSERYPLTRWWWGDGVAVSHLFPEWSKAAFDREAAEWRRLAKDAVEIEDVEVGHWGQFARTTANRILAGSWAEGSEPLRSANLALVVVGLLDPHGAAVPRRPMLERLVAWLDSVAEVSATGFWSRTRMMAEAARLMQQVGGVPAPEGETPERWATLQEAVRAAVGRYSERAASTPREGEPIPWAVSAHVSVDDWRQRRQRMSLESPIMLTKPVPTERLLGLSQPRAAAIQEVVVPGLRQWWVKPGPQGDLLFHGDTYDPSVSLGALLSLWRHTSGVSELTWALSQPPFLEGGLMMVAQLVEKLWPTWPPTRQGFLAQWLQRRRALAGADAWLWLEAGDPVDVLGWLSRFLSREESIAVLPWMKTHPGYYVMSIRVWEVLQRESPARDWTHWVFGAGPAVPQDAFLAPD